jgi:hypothetical protein
MQKVRLARPKVQCRRSAENILFTHVPVTLIALGLAAGLSADAYRVYQRDEAVVDCKPQFVIDLYDKFYSDVPAQAKQQAMIAWMQGVYEIYGAPYANFWDAKGSYAAVKPCRTDSVDTLNYCGFASGQPCRR